MGCFRIHIFDSIGWCRDASCVEEATLAGNRVDWLRWLADTSRHTRDAEVDDDRQQGREQGGEGVVHATVLVNLNDLVNQPADEVHPREGSREGETGDDGVQGLRFEFLADERNSFSGGHGIYYN